MNSLLSPDKFKNPHITAKGENRAQVHFKQLSTVWFNTGSQCNIECVNCYIKSSPTADHFVYLTPKDMAPYLQEVAALCPAPIEIGFTGGEPFLNPHIIRLMEMALEDGHQLLILTNAMKPMMRPRVKAGLLDLLERFPQHITLRISLDHFTAKEHDTERGAGSFNKAIEGMNWLSEQGFSLHIAGRSMFSENEANARQGYKALIEHYNWPIDSDNPAHLLLFPEMDETIDVPEITEACWQILDVSPNAMMCAESRMIVRRKGEDRPAVLACTLLWDDMQFETGKTLKDSLGPVALNHPHCAKFCVLGGASCSA
ncbi:MoaA/NifB/PqqE/SkfB family radical SAM enzyme [Litorimonas taeanensis]|uniref:MoaA/NifB/PqqE/SkfB family radical SAM enzyme n=1 Tax=Litorimonas taeanensis TaxID=568099 RepID=A0A420WJE2_9PROT|nr:radical SAM protein [Litorimonas taeanensis]RKQ71118.1 MoaA/NifB/PqqE/SkfB family radical SAM enzyme [Litorimonas taeanensis]